MKQSIKKIFQNLKTYLFFVLFIAFVSFLLSFEQSFSYKKVDNLRNQKEIISTLTTLDKSDLELALIQFNAKSTQLYQEIDKLRLLYKYAYIEKFFLKNEQEYFQDLNRLAELTDKFNHAAKEYYVDTKEKKIQEKTKENLEKALHNINKHIDSILLKTLTYNEKKFLFIKNALILLFILILLATFYYQKTLKAIYQDIEFLYQVDKNKKTYDIFSQEADAISLCMNRKITSNENPDMIDSVTNINNYKGMLHDYTLKKEALDSKFTSVTLFEIDNFSKFKSLYTQDVIQDILKKVAYTISLCKQPIDIIARTDDNQFTIIFSRSSKEQAYKEIERIRQNIAELKFNIPHQGSIQITISGGFITKAYNTSLQEAIKQTKEILLYAKSIGKNRILQNRDMVQREF